jgi:hypothetical protein
LEHLITVRGGVGRRRHPDTCPLPWILGNKSKFKRKRRKSDKYQCQNIKIILKIYSSILNTLE